MTSRVPELFRARLFYCAGACGTIGARSCTGLNMKFVLAVVAIAVALLVPFLIPGVGKRDGVDPDANLPWQIATDASGQTTVFGLQPGVSTLADVKRRLGADVEVAVIAELNEVGSLEAYYSQVSLGFVLARVIVTVDANPELIIAMRDRALKAEHMESATRKIKLSAADLAAADALPVRAISVIPTVNLDETTILQRFGVPGERLVVSKQRVHLLYPKLGLDVIVDGEGKELLQYVAPRDFARLRAPLDAFVDAVAVAR